MGWNVIHNIADHYASKVVCRDGAEKLFNGTNKKSRQRAVLHFQMFMFSEKLFNN